MKFETSDGKQFDRLEAAQEHEAAMEEFNSFHAALVQAGYAQNVVKAMVRTAMLFADHADGKPIPAPVKRPRKAKAPELKAA